MSVIKNTCTPRQQELVNKIFSVHENLRKKFRMVSQGQEEEDWKKIWEIHKQNSEELQEYSVAMHELATQVWDPRNVSSEDPELVVVVDGESTSKLKCRIEWVYFKCQEYFPTTSSAEEKKLLKLLDVGSCYNPFNKYPHTFDITAVDLCPAPDFINQVYQCDFLEVEVDSAEFVFSSSNDPRQIQALPENYFDLVVFSFFLEYLPDRKQRLESCWKAIKVLRTGGVLFIIRPDSSMSEGNVRLMKELKVGLSLLGMRRLACEKLTHMWCSAYIKLSEQESGEFRQSKRFLNDLNKVQFSTLSDLFAIPQDFKSIPEDRVEGEGDYEHEEYDPSLTEELPFSF